MLYHLSTNNNTTHRSIFSPSLSYFSPPLFPTPLSLPFLSVSLPLLYLYFILWLADLPSLCSPSVPACGDTGSSKSVAMEARPLVPPSFPTCDPIPSLLSAPSLLWIIFTFASVATGRYTRHYNIFLAIPTWFYCCSVTVRDTSWRGVEETEKNYGSRKHWMLNCPWSKIYQAALQNWRTCSFD